VARIKFNEKVSSSWKGIRKRVIWLYMEKASRMKEQPGQML
jgi:hypothetical protein